MTEQMDDEQDQDSRPKIVTTNTTAWTLLPRVLRAITEGQQTAPRLFVQHGGILVRLRDSGRGDVEILNSAGLTLELDRAIQFLSVEGTNVRKVSPPPKLVDGMLASDRFPDKLPELPTLRRVASAPYFTKAGDLIMQQGYNAGAGTYLRLPPSLVGMSPPAPRPSRAQVEAAKRVLVSKDDGGVFGDFRFEAMSSRAHALALLITPFVREMIQGVIPMAVIIAPAVGSGKTLVAKVVSRIVTGKEVAPMSGTLEQVEFEKRVLPMLINGVAYGLIDNAVGKIDSPNLAALLTGDEWTGRVLGKSKVMTLQNLTQWVITGNNLEFTPEIARRSICIALNPPPTERHDFKHDPIEVWIEQARPLIVSSILTLVQHWLAESRPQFVARVLPSYESYGLIVGGILQAAGLDEGFLQPTQAERPSEFDTYRKPVKDADEDLVKLVKEWDQVHYTKTVDTAMLLEIIPKGFCTAPGVLLDLAKDRKSTLGRFMVRNQGRIIDGLRIQPEKIRDDDSRIRNAWRLVDVKREAENA